MSAVFDNIPLTALALKQGGYDWGFLAYAVGFGGSMIWFGSSAGVALSNQFPEAKSAIAWLRGGWHVAVAYVDRVRRDARRRSAGIRSRRRRRCPNRAPAAQRASALRVDADSSTIPCMARAARVAIAVARGPSESAVQENRMNIRSRC